MHPTGQHAGASRRRATLVGAVLLVVVVLLWLSRHSPVVSDDVTASTRQSPPEDRIPSSSITAPSSQTVALTQPSDEGFSVSVRLQYDSTDALVMSRVREYY